MKTTRTLNDGSILTVKEQDNQYFAKVSSDTRNIGFDGDQGQIKDGETIDSIADELAMWMNDNLNE
jgi:hypothetical protein